MEFVLRPAIQKDTEAILELIKALAEFEKRAHEVVATKELLHTFLFAEKKVAHVFIAEFESKPVGFALYFYNFSTFLGRPGIYLEDLFVKPEYRGKGLGLKLFKQVVREAVENGYGRVDWAVLDWNSSAINFYKQLGAKEVKEWLHYRLTRNELEKL
jgi:GNAT superfamily N-acetyltransferase